MSALFQSGRFEYQLPTAVGAADGAPIVLQSSGSLAFSQPFTATCSLSFGFHVLDGLTLTITTCGPIASAIISAPVGSTLEFDLDSPAVWGYLDEVVPPIPASLFAEGTATLGVLPLRKVAGDNQGWTTLTVCITNSEGVFIDNIISFNAPDTLTEGTYIFGGRAQELPSGAARSLFLGSYAPAI